MSLTIPLQFSPRTGFKKDVSEVDSICSFIELLVATPKGSCESDPDFGFVFKSFRFENFNEERGVISSPDDTANQSVFYRHKVHGRSINSNPFAHDLKRSIEQYEPRLHNPKVVMEYKQKEKTIVLTVSGTVGDGLPEPFSHQIKIHVW